MSERAFNILAVDWYDGGSSKGSDPNNNIPFGPLDVENLNFLDAQKSADNGIAAAATLAQRLNTVVGAALHPEKMMLIGHSNGSGFMASMALTLEKLRGEEVGELVALDAPTVTSAWGEVVSAAAAGIRTDNYYMPLAQLGLSLAGVIAGLGQRMIVSGPNVELTNFSLDATASQIDLGLAGVFEIGHFVVPDRYAKTGNADDNPNHEFPYGYWGFQESAYANGSSDVSDSFPYWSETVAPGYFVKSTSPELTEGGLLIATETLFDAAKKTATSIVDTVRGSIAQAWKGAGRGTGGRPMGFGIGKPDAL